MRSYVAVVLLLAAVGLLGWKLSSTYTDTPQEAIRSLEPADSSTQNVVPEGSGDLALPAETGASLEREALESEATPAAAGATGSSLPDDAAEKHTLRLEVTGPDGAPVAGCPVAVLLKEPSTPYICFDLVTDALGLAAVDVSSGSYYVDANSSKGPVPLTGELLGLSSDYGEIELTEDTEWKFTLQRLSASLEVEVVDDLGAPVEGVEVRVHATVQREGVTDAKGLMVADWLLPGQANVRLHAATEIGVAIDDESGNRNLEVLANRRARVRYVLKRHGTAKLRITAPDAHGDTSVYGDPGQSAAISLRPVARGTGARTTSRMVGIDEFYSVPNLVPGYYSIHVSFMARCELGLPAELEPIEIRAGEVTERDLQAVRLEARVSGRLLQRDGTPAALVPLAFFSIGEDDRPLPGQGKSIRSDADGRFTVSGVTEGRWAMRANVNLVKGVNYAWPVQFHEVFQVPGPDLVVTLDPGASIVGRVAQDQGDGQEPVRLEIDRYQFPLPSSFPISDGEVTIRHLRPGPYRLRWLDAAGEPLSEEPVVVPEGAEVSVVFGDSTR